MTAAARWAWRFVIGGLGFLVGSSWALAVRQGHAYDFGAFYSAAEAVRWGDNPYAAAAPPYVYPPLLAQAGAALPRMLRETAYRRLSLMSCVAAVLAFGLVLLYRARGVDGSPEDDAITLAIGLGLLLVLPFRDNLVQGQVNAFVLLAIALAVWLEARGRPLAAGAALAPAVLLKATPVVFALWWIARRRAAALAGLAAGGATLVLGSLASGGWPLWVSYLRLLRGLAAGSPPPGLPPFGALFNLSVAGFCARVLPSAWSRPAAVLVLLGLAILTARAIARAATPEAEHGALLAVLALTVMAPPLAYRHHLILLFPALLLFLGDALRDRAYGRAAMALVGALLASINFPDRAAYLRLDAAGGAARLLTSLNLYGVLLLFALGARYASGGGRRVASAGMSVQAPSAEGT
jgi:hypothetical protein